MKILFDITHPAHVHLFKNVLWNLEKKGHEILVTTLDKDITIKLLELYNIDYIATSNIKRFGLIGKWAIRDFEIFKIAKRFNPNILIGVLNPCVAHASALLRKMSIIFNDTEYAKFAASITYLFASVILTPSCFKKDLGKKQVHFNGYKELAYLHPNYFKPNPEVLDELNLSKEDKFVIVRFISWNATHDIGYKGFDPDFKIKMVKMLERYGKVFITSESKLNKELDKYKIKVSPEKIHNLLYYASLYIGEGGTTSTEAAVLGTPSILLDPGAKYVGNHNELMKKYKLQFYYANQNEAFKKALEILENKNAKKEWQIKREKMLKEKIDVTKFMVDFIENYPESFYKYQKTKNDAFQ